MAQEQIPVYIEDEMKKSYLDYAMSVIVGRALPDVCDGPRSRTGDAPGIRCLGSAAGRGG